MGKEIRLGIIGVGQIGKSHLNTYKGIPDAKMVAAADVNEAELTRVAGEFGIEHTYTDYKQLLKRDDLDAVDVCLHNNFHAPITIAALKAGKNVYCEKPMAGTYIDACRMKETAEETGKMLHIQLSTLYSKEHKAAKHLIDTGALGQLYYARSFGFRRRGRPYVDGYGTWSFVQKQNSAGGALYDMGVYHIAQILHLLGNPEILTISGATHQEVAMYDKQRQDSGYNVEELGLGFARLAGGITFSLEESWALHFDGSESSRIHGSAGGLKLSPLTYYSVVNDVEYSANVDAGGPDFRWHRWQENYDAYDSSQHHWIAALQGRVELLPTAAVALNTMLISEGIYQSTELGKEVTAAEVRKRSKSTAIKV